MSSVVRWTSDSSNFPKGGGGGKKEIQRVVPSSTIRWKLIARTLGDERLTINVER